MLRTALDPSQVCIYTCVYIYICIYIHTYIYLYTYVESDSICSTEEMDPEIINYHHINIYICVIKYHHVDIYMFTYVYIYIYKYIYIYTYMYIYIYIYVYMNKLCVYIRIHNTPACSA
jgi:hypothetical protein